MKKVQSIVRQEETLYDNTALELTEYLARVESERKKLTTLEQEIRESKQWGKKLDDLTSDKETIDEEAVKLDVDDSLGQ